MIKIQTIQPPLKKIRQKKGTRLSSNAFKKKLDKKKAPDFRRTPLKKNGQKKGARLSSNAFKRI